MAALIGARERRILEAFVDALIPGGARLPSGNETEVAARLAVYLDGFAVGPRFLFPAMLWVVELFPLGLGPWPRPFTRLTLAERTRVLYRLEHHRVYPIRGAYLGLKLLAFLLHGESARVASDSGWGQGGAR